MNRLGFLKRLVVGVVAAPVVAEAVADSYVTWDGTIGTSILSNVTLSNEELDRAYYAIVEAIHTQNPYFGK